jgi:bifunctional DNA-binding transcriptional regulator/antitoxin component of YhaV-PrlF toxin-antitoxin module
VTIPADIRRLLGVRPHDQVTFVVEGDQVRLTPATSVTEATAGMLRHGGRALAPAEETRDVEAAMADEAEGHR